MSLFTEELIEHLGNVCEILIDLHPDYQSTALINAIEFFNICNNEYILEPSKDYTTYLLTYGPIEKALGLKTLQVNINESL